MSDDIDPQLLDLLNEIEFAEVKAKETEAEEVEEAEEAEEAEEVEEADRKNIDSGISSNIELDTDENDINDFNSLEDDDLDEKFEDIIEAEIDNNDIDEEKERMEKNILGLLQQHCDSAKAMFDEAEVDRRKIDDIVAIVLPKLESNDYKGSDIMALSNLIQTKADISKNRASNMDSIAKLFAALKNNDRISAGSGGGDDDISNDELIKLLGNRG